MKYPNKIMKLKELKELGFTEAYLMRAFSSPGQTFAWRENPANKHSPIMFSTEGLEEWIMQDCKMQEKARKTRTTVA